MTMRTRGTFYIAGGGTGGHLYPGLAIADAIIAQRPDMDIMFIGARRGIERTVLPTTRWRHELLDLHPLYRAAPWKNWMTIRGFASAWRRIGALTNESAALGILGTGGYAAGALLAFGRAKNIPYFLQEQNAVAGLTVRTFSAGARATYLGFPEARESLPAAGRTRALITGNPISPPPAQRVERAVARAQWGFASHIDRVLLIFGGSQGSRAINDAVAAWLPTGLAANWGAIWVTGKAEHERFVAHANERVRVIAYQQPMAEAYAAVDVAISRAGAMSTAELCAWGIPMVLIPLPTAAADHQTQNAAALARSNVAIMIPQSDLAGGALGQSMSTLTVDTSRLQRMGLAASERARVDAAQVIASHILTSVNL
jgi:UDP-N-acetylglucosamine--N-acetylmuramyl-(pentapeptide) pyrophosphoryl-undecaprenol N-acetylglucosamine transferase